MRRLVPALAILAWIAGGSPSVARVPPALAGLQPSDVVQAVETHGTEAIITADGGQLSLGGLYFPSRQAGATDPEAALAELLTGHQVQPLSVSATPDRHGRLPVQLLLLSAGQAQALWVQEELLARGLAVVMTGPETGPALREAMLAVEAEARAGRRGLWAASENAILRADDPDRIQPGFRLVEGRVLAIGESRHSLFLNFGPDWRTDFTVIVQRSDRSAFKGGLRGLRALEGQTIRIRGRVFQRGGPSIRALHQNAIEVLETQQ